MVRIQFLADREKAVILGEGLTPYSHSVCICLCDRGPTPPLQSFLLPPGKARRLKQAKEEAQMEVDQYRREREQEFQSKQQAVSRGGVEMGPPVCMVVGISGGMCTG